jgi:thiamine-monophosphate kinase
MPDRPPSAEPEPPSFGAGSATEDSVIQAILRDRHRGGPTPSLDVGDDVAVLPSGEAVGADMLIEGVHWDARSSAEDVGYKAVMVNASDLGATGATPRWLTLSLALPDPPPMGWVTGFARGLHAACAALDLRLIGGDTTRSPGPIVVSISMGGPLAHGRAVRRSGGAAGDQLYVTGGLGQAAAGFFGADPSAEALRRPRPPIALGLALAASPAVHAMMDVSDGLSRDLRRLCAASGLGAEVWPEALPLGQSVPAGPEGLAWATAWGDDYALLVAISPEWGAEAQALAAALGAPLSHIGQLHAGSGLRFRGTDVPQPIFDHFSAPPASPPC